MIYTVPTCGGEGVVVSEGVVVGRLASQCLPRQKVANGFGLPFP